MDQDDWDERYAGREFVWEVAPNQFVQRHLTDLPAGTAIDLAAGEGRNAVWLASQGWRVIAVDFSVAGLEKGRRLAANHGVSDSIDFVLADALTYQPADLVDLVVISYFQATPDDQRTALQHAASWLRPGGTLFVVAHDRSNVEHGYGGPSSAEHCYDLDTTIATLDGLEIRRAEVAKRAVETDEGSFTALDTVVIAARPQG